MEVKLIGSMGNDLTVVNAARVSFHKESLEYDERDERLIRYLARHNHWTPFSQVQYQVRISAPIFVARQWFKHQIGITRNEVSRRYVDDNIKFHIPTEWRGRPTNAKQGSDGVITSETIDWVYHDTVKHAEDSYNLLLREGVAPEQARMVLPQSMMTEWFESGSLAAAARIAKLRLDPHSQLEIQELAKMFASEIETIAPISWGYLMEV